MKLNFKQKIAAVQQEIGAITKNAINPHFKNKYFDINTLINQLNPILHKHGLLLVQPIKEGAVVSSIEDQETGDAVTSELTLPQLDNPQKIGSAISYYRRYTLTSLLALQAEDDDAQAASKPKAQAKPVMVKDSDNWNRAVEKKIPANEVIKYMTFTDEVLEAYKKAIK